jgi:hypothetical protein
MKLLYVNIAPQRCHCRCNSDPCFFYQIVDVNFIFDEIFMKRRNQIIQKYLLSSTLDHIQKYLVSYMIKK